MIAMQYKISLPSDYDMDIIKKRIKENGHKTDGFEGLLFKFYLVAEKESNSVQNEYSPLYIWKDYEGMNKFIFKGFYDNILNSFGWQNIKVKVPFDISFDDTIVKSRYVVEIKKNIEQTTEMKDIKYSLDFLNTNKMILYSPDSWEYVEYYFFEEKPNLNEGYQMYEILHIS